MKINIYQNTLNIMTEDRSIIDTSISETYMIYPDEGKILKYLPTGALMPYANIKSKKGLEKFIEVDIEE